LPNNSIEGVENLIKYGGVDRLHVSQNREFSRTVIMQSAIGEAEN
jgi:hypothetical protein